MRLSKAEIRNRQQAEQLAQCKTPEERRELLARFAEEERLEMIRKARNRARYDRQKARKRRREKRPC